MTAGIQMFIIFLLIVIGFICCKVGLIDKKNNACLSRLVVNVFNPAMIFSSVLGNAAEGTRDSIFTVFLVSAGIYLFLIIIAKPLSRLSGKTLAQRHVAELLYIFANVGFIGIPVVKALLGSDKLIYVAIYMLEFNILVYTYGMYLLHHTEDSKKTAFRLSDLKPLFNMGTLACAATLFIFLSNLSLPSPVADTLQYLANATTPLSLIVIGVSLGLQENISVLFTNIRRYLFCICKLILLPVVGTFVMKRLPISEDLCQTYMVMLAMPTATIVLMMTEDAGIDGTECAHSISLSTLLSVLTIPLLVLLYPYL